MILVLSFFVLTILFFGLLFSKVKVNIKKLEFEMYASKLYKNDYWINVGIYLFGKVKIFGINFRKDAIKIMGKKINYEKIKNSNVFKDIVKPEIKEIDRKEFLEDIKKIYIKFEKFTLNLSLGTDSTLITSFLVFVISTAISIILKKGISRYNPRKHKFEITPMYKNCNLISFNLNSVISFKLFNIIKVFSHMNKITRKQEKITSDSLINKKKHYPGYV